MMKEKETKKIQEEITAPLLDEIEQIEQEIVEIAEPEEIIPAPIKEDRKEFKENIFSWVPKTKLGLLVKQGKEKDIDKILEERKKILEPEIIDLIPEGFAMLEKDVFPIVAHNGKLFGYPFSGQWFDTGNIERYEKALDEWKDIKVR